MELLTMEGADEFALKEYRIDLYFYSIEAAK